MLLARVLLLWLFSLPLGAQYSLDPVGACSAEGVSDAVKALLEAGGHRVKDPSGAVFVEAWIRQAIPVEKAAEAPRGADFSAIPVNTLLGVIRYSRPAIDFRGQAIRPGTYTMRYNRHPEDGDHQGVAPRRDFLLLIPAPKDQDPAANLTFEAAVELSRQASGTTHPSVVFLVAPDSGAKFPSVHHTSSNHEVLQVKAGSVALGITVVGKTEE